MKKSFTLFTILALFLMLLFPVSVKADTTLSFVYTTIGQDKYCNGNNSDNSKGITNSDFHWSGNNEDNIKMKQNISSSGDNWTGVDDNISACSRNKVTFSGSYTVTLLVRQESDNVERVLPSFTINEKTYYAAQARWMEGETQMTETISDNKFYFKDEYNAPTKHSRDREVTLVYNNVNPGNGSYDISVYFPSGNRDKFLVKTITFTSNAPTYAVSATASNGSVSGTGSYAEGAEVTLTASPNDNYSFTNWSSSDISIADASANPLVFTMPGNAVSVTANFAACTKHTVTLTANNGSYGSTSGGGEQCDGSVTVTATPNSGYRFVNWTNTSTGAEVSTDAEHTFPLSADISLTANFEVDPCLSSLTVEVEGNYAASGDYSGVTYPSNILFIEKDPSGSEYRQGCHGTGYVSFEESTWAEILIPVNIPVSGTYKVKAYAGRNKNMYINIYATTSTAQGSITYKSTTYYKQTYKKINESHGTDSFVESDYTDDVALPTGICLIGLYAEWSHSAWDQITITRTDGTAFCPNTITMAKSGDDGAVAPTASPANAAMAGTEVTITAGEASANHYFSGWTVSPENAVTFADPANPTTTFVMPETDVTITANYGVVVSSALTFSAGEGGSITSATAGGNTISSGDNVVSGTSVTLTAAASGDYVFVNWTDDNNSNAVVSTNIAYTFSMLASATSYTANFALVDNVIVTGIAATITAQSGDATLTVTSVSDFDVFDHNVLKFAYSNMDGKYKGQKVAINAGYSYASSAGATGFGFYYKTEKADDHVAFCFDPQEGQEKQVKWQLAATNNVWKYVYIPRSEANSWNRDGIIIYMNGSDNGNYGEWEGQSTSTNYPSGGAFYMSEIAATSITSKPDIDTYHYTNNRGGNMAVDDYGTLCLPMAGTVSGAALYSVAGTQQDGDKLYIVLKEEDALEAGQPYITQSTATSYTVTMSGVHSAAAENVNGLKGTYVQMNLAENINHYILSANKLMQVGSGGVTMGAYRAYLDLSQVGEYNPSSSAPGRYVRMAIDETGAATGIESVEHSAIGSQKILRNGQIFILRNGVEYNVNGQMTK